MKIGVVVPTCRPDLFLKFAEAWEVELSRASVRIVVVDGEVEPGYMQRLAPDWIVVDHNYIEDELGSDSWIIPTGSDAIRSFGFLKALEEDVEAIVTLDDDVRPLIGEEVLATHEAALATPAISPAWESFLEPPGLERGFPTDHQRVEIPALHVGLWKGEPDVWAATLSTPEGRRAAATVHYREGVIPRGRFAACSSMNLSFRVQLAPAMWFGLQGIRKQGIDRFGDIWAGVLAKKILDHLGGALTVGEPYVLHGRASDLEESLVKELAGLPYHRIFWETLDRLTLRRTTVTDCVLEIAEGLSRMGVYFANLGRGYRTWVELVHKYLEPEIAE